MTITVQIVALVFYECHDGAYDRMFQILFNIYSEIRQLVSEAFILAESWRVVAKHHQCDAEASYRYLIIQTLEMGLLRVPGYTTAVQLLIHPRIRIGELDAPRIGRTIYETRQIPISARGKAPDLEKRTRSVRFASFGTVFISIAVCTRMPVDHSLAVHAHQDRISNEVPIQRSLSFGLS